MSSSLKNLLIVEDNKHIGNNIFVAAKRIDSIKKLQLTESLQEAISLLTNTNNFNLIILDLNLPDGNGLELLKIFKENHANKKILVFSTSIELKEICLRYGAYAFFDKADDFDKLIKTIKTLR